MCRPIVCKWEAHWNTLRISYINIGPFTLESVIQDILSYYWLLDTVLILSKFTKIVVAFMIFFHVLHMSLVVQWIINWRPRK